MPKSDITLEQLKDSLDYWELDNGYPCSSCEIITKNICASNNCRLMVYEKFFDNMFWGENYYV